MRRPYTILHAVATLLGLAALAYQTFVVWEVMAGFTDVERLGIPLATTSAALLPVIAEAAWRTKQRCKALVLLGAVAALVAFIVPSGISRLGEAADVKAASAVKTEGLLVQLRLDRDSAAKSAREADGALAEECRSGKGKRCEGLTHARAEALSLRDKIDSKIASHQAVAQPWLPSWHPALLPLGMELAIWSCLWFGLAPAAARRPSRPRAPVKRARRKAVKPRPMRIVPEHRITLH